MQLESQAELLIVDVVVSSEVQQRVVEVRKGFLEISHEEIRDTLLEVRHCEILIELNSSLIAVHLAIDQRDLWKNLRRTYGFLMLAKRRMYNATVEQYL